MEVWHLAGDYWRRGLRYGDVLPERCPSFRITRLPDGGWISLSPKDLHLLTDAQPAVQEDPVVLQSSATGSVLRQAQEPYLVGELVEPQGPLEQPTVQPKRAKRPARRKRVLRQAQEPCAVSGSSCVPSVASDHRSSAAGSVLRQAQEPCEMQEPLEQARSCEHEHNDEKMRKAIAIVGAVAITLLMIHFFGLLGPAVFGLLAGGILKG